MTKTATAAILAMVALTTLTGASALAQTTTLRTPLIYGANSAPPMSEAEEGQPPAIGSGDMPAPVTPGMMGRPTVLPSVPITPANYGEYSSVRINVDPMSEDPAGQLGPSTWAPPPPSTMGADPGIIHAPLDFHPPPAQVVNINPDGGIPGNAGTERWGGQQTHDWGRYKNRGKRSFDFGEEEFGSTSEDGPNQALPGARGTQDLYGDRMPRRNNGHNIVQTIAPW